MTSTGAPTERLPAFGGLRDIGSFLELPAAIAATFLTGVSALFMFRHQALTRGFGWDAHAYWLAGRTEHPYGVQPGQSDAFNYSPAFAQLVHPLAALPWPIFGALWMLATLGLLAWLVKPVPRLWVAPLFLLGLPEVMAGNVFAVFAVVAVIGLTRPGAWGFVLLTKITPGIGLLWFLTRREWARLTVALAVTAAVAAVSVVADPGLWVEWIRFLSTSNSSSGSTEFLLARVALGAALVGAGARTDRPWVLPWAMLVATPVLATPAPLMVLLAVPRLLQVKSAAEPCLSVRTVEPLQHKSDEALVLPSKSLDLRGYLRVRR